MINDKVVDNMESREGKVKKWVVVVGFIVGVMIAGGILLGTYYFIDMDGYLNTKQIVHLYDFYEEKNGTNENSIYFLGNSIIGYSIYPPEINRLLDERGYNMTAYNLFLNSESQLEMALQTKKIINANPKLVIIGVIPRNFYYSSWIEERVVLVHDELEYDSELLNILSDIELSQLETKNDLIYQRKYIISAIKFKYFPSNWNDGIYELDYSNDYTHDPIGEDYRVYLSNSRKDTSLIDIIAEENPDWHPIFSNESNQQKVAFNYMINRLSESNIPVVIVNMPLYPLHSELITDESRNNYYNLLNETGVTWFDMEKLYNKSLFMDHSHLSYDGALEFAPVMTDLIIDLVENDVIHYS